MADEIHVHSTEPNDGSRDVHVHQTPPSGGGGGGTVLLVIVVLVLLGVIAWFMFAGGGEAVEDAGTDINVEAPQIDVPDEVDVNVN